MINLRPVFNIISILVFFLGLGMLVPALADLAVGNRDWKAFVVAAAFTVGISGAVYLSTQDEPKPLTVRQFFLLTTLSWLVTALVCAVPFMWSTLHLSFTDAVFESMSGLTTTGGTVIVGLDNAPPGVLLWRALLNWFGGVGIIVMAITILPVLRVGGMQLFRTESSDRGEKPFATLRETANAIALIYVTLTVLAAVAYRLAGMPTFDAICHAMAVIATGGFSTKDASIGAFGSQAIIWVTTFGMLAGSLPLTWYIRALRGTGRVSDEQIKLFLIVMLAASVVMSIHVLLVTDLPPSWAITHAFMNVVSIATTTGFVSADYSLWGNFAVTFFFLLFFVGGCTGSTTGAIKIFRWMILFKGIRVQMTRMVQPHRIALPMYEGKPVGADVIESVINFAVMYFVVFAVLTAAVAAQGMDFVTAVTGVAAAIGNVGPALGHLIGPAGTYQPVEDGVLWVFTLGMLLGRLEIFTALILLSPGFWRS
ncbi:MAG TPA: TrkH family potassium uptake protein [Azospirillaceae bacterium]|nr:TrkH family potassium uptake protein [Azospirillaceae bacterium]